MADNIEEVRQKAREFLQNLPDNPDYQSGELVYPPRGQGDIAYLMATFFCAAVDELLKRERESAYKAICQMCKHGIPITEVVYHVYEGCERQPLLCDAAAIRRLADQRTARTESGE